jgi:hypothetical protein
MTGAKGQRCLDLDAEPVRRRAAAIMSAVDDKTSRCDRFQPEETLGDPILGGDALKTQSPGRRVAGRRNCQIADDALVDIGAEVEGNAPAALARIHKADRGLVVKECRGKAIGDPPRRSFIGCQRSDRGIRCVGKRSVIHCSIDRFQSSTPNSQDRHRLVYSHKCQKYSPRDPRLSVTFPQPSPLYFHSMGKTTGVNK